MEKCSGCGCNLDDTNTNYDDLICDDCYEEDEDNTEEEDEE